MEKIKFGEQTFELVPNGINLGVTGGTIKFQMGESDFETIESTIKKNGNITQLNTAGEQDWTRTDLIYAGSLQKQSDYVVGTEKVENGTDEEGNTTYEEKEVKADVMTAWFRTPDIKEEVAAVNAKVDFIAMVSDVDMGGVE